MVNELFAASSCGGGGGATFSASEFRPETELFRPRIAPKASPPPPSCSCSGIGSWNVAIFTALNLDGVRDVLERESSAKSTDLDLLVLGFLILEYPFILCLENGEQMLSRCGRREGNSLKMEEVESIMKELVMPRFGGKDIGVWLCV